MTTPKTPEDSYKLRKQDFVSNHTGGTLTEINLVTSIAFATYILFAVLQSRLRFFSNYGFPQVALDFILNCGALLLSVTLYASQPVLLDLLVLSPAVLIYLTASPSPKIAKPKPASDTASSPLPKKAFITVYRGMMMVLTCIAILAVDFRVFPRRFAKVENWGTSIMDLGVGSFVFSSGIVSARSIVREQRKPSLSARLQTAMRNSLPLLVLGFVRLAMVKGVDYAEHVTEYGVHWNFFFTLALLPPFVALLQSVPVGSGNPTTVYTVLSLAVAGGYQVLLKTTGLEEYVLIGDRHKYGLLGMNKEGASSFAGYLAIFLAGVATGTYTLPRSNQLLKTLLSWSAFWIAAFVVASEYRGLGIGVSRRLANMSYVFWVAAFNTAQLAGFYLVETTLLGKRLKVTDEKEAYKLSVPRVLEAFNRNGLAVFLVANLLTGIVNVSLKTLDYGREAAMGVLTAYIAAITAVALGLDYANLSIKL